MPPRIVMLLYGFLRRLFCCGCNLEASGAVPEENLSRRNTQTTRLHVIVDDPSDVTFTTPKPPLHQELVGQSNVTLRETVGREKNLTRGADGEDFEHVSHSSSISEMNKEKSRPAITQEGSSKDQRKQAFTRGPDVDLDHNRRRCSTVYFDAPSFPTTASGVDGAGTGTPAENLDDADQVDGDQPSLVFLGKIRRKIVDTNSIEVAPSLWTIKEELPRKEDLPHPEVGVDDTYAQPFRTHIRQVTKEENIGIDRVIIT